MVARRYQQVQSRNQMMMYPFCLDDYVSADNPVRVIDAFVDSLDMEALGFRHADAYGGAGQPAFDPALLLKLYLYGYQERVRSSRRLAAEMRRNMEVMWLCQNARPSYRTIAGFRRNNGKALKAASRAFVAHCRELSLIGGSTVAIDGTYMKALAGVASFHTKRTLARDLERVEALIAAYYRQLAEADGESDGSAEDAVSDDAPSEDAAKGVASPDSEARLEALNERKRKLEALSERRQESGEGQVSEVDADARMLRKNGKTVGGYNCQIAVDDKHKLIVADEVVQDGNDKGQLEPMMKRAVEAVGNESVAGVADAGYCSGEQIKACEEQGLDVHVPVPKQAAHAGRDGRFGSDDFTYDAEADEYVCPAGERLSRGGSSRKGGTLYHCYRASVAVCQACPLLQRCLSKSVRARCVCRSEHADAMDRHRRRMQSSVALLRRRGSLVEHPFGTLKRNAGLDQFLMRGLGRCRGEFSLMTLGYNLKRAVNVLGVSTLVAHFRQRASIGAVGA